MSNLARELQQQKQQRKQTIQEPKPISVKKSWLTPGEKLLGITFAAMVCFGALHIISTQAKIYQVNEDIQTVQNTIQTQQRVNSDLSVQVNELSNYSRISSIAKKMGLQLNENNIKVVQGQ